jgi:hypothetical protein
MSDVTEHLANNLERAPSLRTINADIGEEGEFTDDHAKFRRFYGKETKI